MPSSYIDHATGERRLVACSTITNDGQVKDNIDKEQLLAMLYELRSMLRVLLKEKE